MLIVLDMYCPTDNGLSRKKFNVQIRNHPTRVDILNRVAGRLIPQLHGLNTTDLYGSLSTMEMMVDFLSSLSIPGFDIELVRLKYRVTLTIRKTPKKLTEFEGHYVWFSEHVRSKMFMDDEYNVTIEHLKASGPIAAKAKLNRLSIHCAPTMKVWDGCRSSIECVAVEIPRHDGIKLIAISYRDSVIVYDPTVDMFYADQTLTEQLDNLSSVLIDY